MRELSAIKTTAWLLAAGLLVLALVVGCGGDVNPTEAKEHFFGPVAMAVEPFPLQDDGPLLYAVNTWGGSLTILRVQGYEIIKDHSDDPFNPAVIWLGTAPHDIAITPDGALLYVADANNDVLRTVDPADPWTVTELDLQLEGARLSIVPAVIDRETLESSTPEVWRERSELWIAEPMANRLLVWDHAAMELAGEVALPGSPVELQVSLDGRQVFVTTDEGMLYVVDAAARALSGVEVALGGYPGDIVENPDSDDLYVLNVDPPRLHIIDRGTWTEVDEQLFFPAALNHMALSTDGEYGFITADDGFVYYYFPERRRVCGSSHTQPRFYDKGPGSNPQLTNIETKDCVTSDEKWRVSYLQLEDAWEVEGTSSGLQYTLAYTGQAYASDRGEIRFVVRGGDLHPSDGDTFRFSTDVGERPVPVGATPRMVVVSPIADDEEFFGKDRVFVADPGTNSVTRLITFDTENRNIID